MEPEVWIEAHADDLFRYAAARLGRTADAEDAVQETLLSALRSARSFRGDSSERTWLIGILKHKIADQSRAAVRQPISADIEETESFFDARGRWKRRPRSFAVEEDDLLENEEFWLQFKSCVDALPARQATVFVAVTGDEKNPEEVCKELEITTTNLWVLLHRARLHLRACLENRWFHKGERLS